MLCLEPSHPADASLRDRAPAPPPALIRLILLMRGRSGASGVLCVGGVGGVILCRGARRGAWRLCRASWRREWSCMGTATRLHQPPHWPCRRCLRLRSLFRELPSVSLRLCAGPRCDRRAPSRVPAQQKRSCAGPKLHPGRPGASKRLLRSLGAAPPRNCEPFAALAAGISLAILPEHTPGPQIQGAPRHPTAHEEPRNIIADQTLACGAARIA